MRSTAVLGFGLCLALGVVPSATMAKDVAPASAPQPKAAPAKAAAKTPAPAKAAKPAAWTGTWRGSLAQVGRAKPFAFELTLAGKTGKSSYADDHCTGKLARVGTSGSYAYFTETITEGKLDPQTMKGCLDGSLTLFKDTAGSLVMSWTAAHDGKAIVAYGTLAPAP